MSQHRLGQLTGILLPLVVALAATMTGCGGRDANGSGGLDRNDPKAVAKAYYETFYDCGERGAGLRWDLQVRVPDDRPRSQDIADERHEGCRPARVPAVQVALGQKQNDLAVVQVDNPDACTPGAATLILLRRPDGWKVDRDKSNFGPDDYVCAANGSTH